jgi:alanyl-tRNA synthetase
MFSGKYKIKSQVSNYIETVMWKACFMKSTNEIRAAFLDYFNEKGHEIVASSPLVPDNDPTLMFVNAGMVPFKNVFIGNETRNYVTASSSQKCVRAGGKHNDLDNVGYTARHHTFFEMLGNFSFGDYFKRDAITYAWDLLVNIYGISKDRLIVTVYHTDDEAFDLWKEISGLPDEKIIRISTNDNFWSMGDTGPCGPCSEIFYDHGDHIFGDVPGSKDEDGDRFVEIWNLVFMQYNTLADGSRADLPNPCIDTGMGLERIAALLQGTHDNYEIDLFQNLIHASAEISGASASGEHNISHRVISDHLRSSAFLIADGVLPSNEGRGYVVRRIMRRAMRHAQIIGCNEPLMYRLVPILVSEMGAAFPELRRAEALITETLRLEEIRFRKTLNRGLKLLEDETKDLAENGILAGDVAFKLYDTYGFPFDLTQDALRSKGLSVDEDGFKAAMEKQKSAARAAWKGSGSAATDDIWFEIREEHGVSEFIGYNVDHTDGKVLEILVNGEVTSSAKAGDEVMILTNQTVFYGESGGQVGDVGELTSDAGLFIEVTDTAKKLGSLHVHIGKVKSGIVTKGDVIHMNVDAVYRAKISANHSATHILHSALHKRLGDYVTQKGSLVSADRFRFDMSQNVALTADELGDIEASVNDIIRQNTEVTTRLMTPEEAIEAGAMALFGEKYGDEVRVVTMGRNAAKLSDENIDYSVELCGGIHVKRTGDIGYFKIITETAVSSGVRRIEALTGAAAAQYMNDQLSLLNHASSTLKTPPNLLNERIKSLISDRKNSEKEIKNLRKKIAMGGNGSDGAEIREIKGVKYIGQILEGVPAKDLRGLADEAKKKIISGVIAFIAVNDGKAAILTAVTDDIKDKISAVDLVKVGAAAVGGKGGGGRLDMAQAGGPNGAQADEALRAIAEFLKN